MRFDSVLLAAGVISTVNAQFIIGAIAAVELVVEFWEAAEVVATVDATVDLGITAEEISAEEFEFSVHETASSGALRVRGGAPSEVAHSVSGDMGLLGARAGASRNLGQAHIEIDGLIVNDNTITPALRVNLDWAADVQFSRSHPGGAARFIMKNVNVNGARFDYVENSHLSAHIVRAGGRLLSTR